MTMSDCIVATIEIEVVQALAERQGDVGVLVSRLLAVENAALSELVACLGRRSARERLAHMLCDVRERLCLIDEEGGDCFWLPLTQEDIGDMTGLTAVHVNRILRTLRTEGVLRQQGRELTILRPDELAAIADFRPVLASFIGSTARRSNAGQSSAYAPGPLPRTSVA